MSDLEIPQHGEREYFRAFGVVALYIVASPTRRVPCLIGYTRDLGASLQSIRSRWHWSVCVTHAWWLGAQESAMKIIDALNAAVPSDSHGRYEAEADLIAARIGRAALNNGIRLTPHADAMRRVRVALARVDTMIEQAACAGELRWFNLAYRRWRTSQNPATAAAMPYGLARAKLRAAVVRRIATGSASPLGRDILGEIFPTKGKAVPAHTRKASAEDIRGPHHGQRTGGLPIGNVRVRYPEDGCA